MLKSSRKKLIAIGCSYTSWYQAQAANRYQDVQPDIKQFEEQVEQAHLHNRLDDFPVWPTLLSEKLDMECVNLGRAGAGNEYISAKLIDTVLTEKREDIGLVVLMWSGWQRIDFERINNNWYNLRPQSDNGKNIKNPVAFLNIKNHETRIILNNIMWKYNSSHNATMKSLRHFLIAQKLLEDIPYLMVQGIGPVYLDEFIERKSKHIWLQSFLNSKIFDEIDEKKFIGWPILKRIGGYTINNMLDKIDPERNQLRISSEDTHPNAEGHKIIAQEVYDAYEKIYI